MISSKRQRKKINKKRGNLRIGDDWNAITIIALSQNNPLKAVAEFVENSIDASSKTVTIIRGKKSGHYYLKVIDDGNGIICTEEGIPDFKYVATHICDSIKRRLKQEGAKNVQGEFGIGLLSFWTLGNKLTIISSGTNSRTYQMEMERAKPGYTILPRPHLAPIKGTQLIVSPLLDGVRSFNGEKIQRYLASELRDRIRHSGVKIKIIDHISRAEFNVEPRKYSGRLLHNLPPVTTTYGDVYTEIYLNEQTHQNFISLFRSGTRVLENIAKLDIFQNYPWVSGYFQGIIDAPFLNLTPGTRDGIIHDERFAQFCEALQPLSERLKEIIKEQEKAEEERMSRNILRSVQKAFREALMVLPREDYDWFNMYEQKTKSQPADTQQDNPQDKGKMIIFENRKKKTKQEQKQFFEFAGPLFTARIQPASALVPVSGTRSFRALGLDRSRRHIEANLSFSWEIVEGSGRLDKYEGEIVVFYAPSEPGLSRLKVTVREGEQIVEAESIITIVDSMVKVSVEDSPISKKGLPGYTLESAPGETWRSRYDEARNLIIINKGHRDFVYATKQRIRKLRYICRLFAKELICHNFLGLTPEELLERMVELSLYTEDNLK